jgi:hypothetical protein
VAGHRVTAGSVVGFSAATRRCQGCGHVTKLPWLAATANEVTAFPGTTAFGANPDYPDPLS